MFVTSKSPTANNAPIDDLTNLNLTDWTAVTQGASLQLSTTQITANQEVAVSLNATLPVVKWYAQIDGESLQALSSTESLPFRAFSQSSVGITAFVQFSENRYAVLRSTYPVLQIEPVQQILAQPSTVELVVGDRRVISITANRGTYAQDVSQTSTAVSSAPATVSLTGAVIQGLRRGTAVVTFSFGGFQAQVPVTVTDPGQIFTNGFEDP